MKKKMLMIVLCVTVIGATLVGCGKEKTADDVTPVVEDAATSKEEEVIEETPIEADAAEEETDVENESSEEHYLTDPVPEDVADAKEILYSIQDPQTACDFGIYVLQYYGENDKPNEEGYQERVQEWDNIYSTWMDEMYEQDPTYFDNVE